MTDLNERQPLPSGDRLLLVLAALASPHRLRILAALTVQGSTYVSALARQLGIGRPLLHLHLQKLEEAGLVRSRLELSAEGKALKFFEIAEFALSLTPASLAAAAATLSQPGPDAPDR
ncbi:ArsR/SmtB family transcription factor [Zavarzinia sp. CC-PAN008]|uniref:ArsR/SmtB family transcription factor n=1 Tax=Zavarzinia sp. CC-PAN008 TaxID=3243332 RepID=UPI003F745FF6